MSTKPNPIDIVPDGYPITLEVGAGSKYGPLLTIIDSEDYGKVAGWWWHLTPRPAYNDKPATFLAVQTVKGKHVSLARLIAEAGPDQIVRHRNGNGLDNRRANLEVCQKPTP